MTKKTATIAIDGMSCDHCVKTVKTALEQSDGVEVLDVEIGSARIAVDQNPRLLESVRHAIDETGFVVVGISTE